MFVLMAANGLRLGDGGALKNVSPTFVQMPNSSTNVEFTTVCPTIAKPMLAAAFIVKSLLSFSF